MDLLTWRSVFGYQEVFEDGRTYHGFSSGKGVFHDAEPEHNIAGQVFEVLKDRTVSSLVVAAYSPRLRSFFTSAFPNATSLYATDSFCYDFKTILGNYTALRELFRSDQWDKLYDVRLFMQDFLLDSDVWSSFGFEGLYEIGILSASHWQDMQKWSTERYIDDLEELIDADDKDDDEDGDSTGALEPVATSIQDLDKWLWHAAREGRTDEIYRHLTQRTRLVDAVCLTVALQRGHIDIFWLLFNFGAAVRGDPERWMAGPIFAAAELGCLEAVQSLVHKANIRDRRRLTKLCFRPLRGAVEGGHEAIVSYFVSLGADFKSGGHWNGMMVRAARAGCLPILCSLRSRGVPLGSAILDAAAQYGHHHIVKYLLDAKVTEKSLLPTRNALSWSIRRNDLPLFNLLLEFGSDPAPSPLLYPFFYTRRRDPILVAMLYGRVDMLRRLVRSCGSLSSVQKESLVHVAKVSNRSAEIIQITEEIPLGVEFWEGWENKFDQCYPYDSQLELSSTLDDYTNKTAFRDEANQGRRATLKKQVSASKDSDHCPFLARIKARARLAMRTRLRGNFLRMHAEFFERSSSLDASYELSTFVQHIGTAQRIWKKGFDSIRRLLNNHLPSSLQEVFACVQLSCSMRSAIDESADVENTEAQDVFLTDLDRWRLVVPNNDQGVYDEITRLVWGKSDKMIPVNTDWLHEPENLEYFQKLMTSLISETHSSWAIPDSCFEAGGQRLAEIHEQFDVHSYTPDECKRSHASSEEEKLSPENDENGRQGGILEKWRPVSPVLMLLTATTIFMVIITFFLLLRFHGMEIASPQFMTNFKIQRSLRHYCYILALYLGLSSPTKPPQMELDILINPSSSHSHYSPNNRVDIVPQEGMEYDSSFLSQSKSSADNFTLQQTPSNSESSSSGGSLRKQCPKCLKTFSKISNLNKHEKTDCKFGKMMRYTCRNMGCRLEFTREAYRDVHEKKRCPVRS